MATQLPQTPVKQVKHSRPFPKIDWLFIIAVILTLAQGMLLFIHNKQRQTYISLKKQDADRIHVIQKATTVSQEDILKLEGAFLQGPDIIAFIQALEGARGYFDTLELRFTNDIPQGKDVKFLTFTLTVVGEKGTVVSLINTLLSSRYALEAKKIELTQDKEDNTKAEFILTGNIYISEELK